jgi:hypothetical protein
MRTRMERKFMRPGVRSMVMSAALAGIAFASTAFAGFTTINSGSTPTQPQILDHVYGGTFTLEDGVDYSNGTLTAVRVSDTTPQTGGLGYDNPGPNVADQLWQASSVTATAEDSNAEYASSPFGYVLGTSGGTFVPLFNITGSGYAVSGTGSFTPGSGSFRFEATNKFGPLSSSPSDNNDGKDHMVTYEINGLGGADKTWLLFFNDYGDTGTDANFNFQNLAIQLQTVPLSTNSTPEPGCMMVIGGLGIALFKRLPRRSI